MAIFNPRRLAFGVAVLAASTLVVDAAQAAPLVREHYSVTETFSFDDCGFQIDAQRTFGGLFMLREGRRGDATPYLFDNYWYENVFTNHETGEWFTHSGNGLYKDLQIVNIEGTVYRFEAIETGRPFQIHDSDGNLVVNDRGHLRVGFTVDTLGDDNLDNDVFIEGSFELLADNGAHPGFYVSFCDIANDLIG